MSPMPFSRLNPQDARQPLSGHIVRTLTPIRAFDLRTAPAGVEPLTSCAENPPQMPPPFLGIISNTTCLIGAERPNVKDEPRRERARLVQQDDLGSADSIRQLVR